MVELQEMTRRAFRQISMVFSLDYARDRRSGIEGSRITSTEGAAGPELLVEAEGMQLRFWSSEQGPGCVIRGAPVIGFLWSRWTQELADRCIGVFLEEKPGEVAWLTMAKGDLPPGGLIDVYQAALRSGPDRLVELTFDMRFQAKIRSIARGLPRETPKALLDRLDEIERGGTKQ